MALEKARSIIPLIRTAKGPCNVTHHQPDDRELVYNASIAHGASGGFQGQPPSDNPGLLPNESILERANTSPLVSNSVPTQERPGQFGLFLSTSGSTTYVTEVQDLLLLTGQSCTLVDTGDAKNTWWLDVFNPTEADINALAKEFSIHPLTSEDIKTGETREKVEIFETYHFVSFSSFVRPKNDSRHHITPVNVYIVVFSNGLISFTFHSRQNAANVRSRIHRLRNHLALSSDWICYALIDDIVDIFSPMIHDLERETSAIEEGVLFTRQQEISSVLSKVHACRKKTMNATQLLRGKPGVVKSLARHCGRSYSNIAHAEIELFFSDIQDHIMTMASKLEHCEEVLSRSHSDYLARLSVDRIGTGNRTMVFIIRITVLAAIIIPLNVICGLFGMNVRVPGGDDDGLFWWFGILGLIVFLILASLIVARRAKVI